MKQWDHLEAERVLDDQIKSWWFQGKRTVFDSLFRNQFAKDALVLDVGAGQGLFLNHLAPAGRLVAVDEWPPCLIRNRQRGGCPVVGDATHLPFATEKFDYLFALDVLEHLPDDQMAVKEWSRVIKKGGRLVLNVPALDCLWSKHDVQMGHYRRYNRAKLRTVVEARGFVCERLTYTNSFLFPLGWLSFHLNLHQGSNDNPEAHLRLPKPIEAMIKLFYSCEAAVLPRVNLPFGGSLVCIAQKRF